jgi:hypothetical protein
MGDQDDGTSQGEHAPAQDFQEGIPFPGLGHQFHLIQLYVHVAAIEPFD